MPGAVMGGLLSFTRKYTIMDLQCRYVPAENTNSMIDELFSKQVIIYDDAKKIAYLCPLINLIVTLVRVYLEENQYNYDRTHMAFPAGIASSQVALRALQSNPVEASYESFKYEDLFKTIVRRYSSVNAVLPATERSTSSKVLAFELADIISNNAPFCPRSLSLGKARWISLAQSIDVVVCGGVGDVIVHRQPTPMRPCLKGPPEGCDILVCPLRLLKKHFEVVDRQNCFKQKGRDDHELVLKGIPFSPCVIDDPACDGRHCWKRRLQGITRLGKISKRLKPKELSPIMTTISWDGDGALCFGRVLGEGNTAAESCPTVSGQQVNRATNWPDNHCSGYGLEMSLNTLMPFTGSVLNGVQT
jgi:hypothetical protein